MDNEKKGWADTNGLANTVTGICIICMAPILLGFAGEESIIGALPWMICAWPIIIIAVIVLLKNGDIVSAMANAILTGMALFNNFIHGIIVLVTTAGRTTLSEETMAGMNMMDGCAYLGSALFLVSVVYMSLKVNKVQALFVTCPMAAFFMLFLQHTGLANMGHIPGVLIIIFSCWQIYSGIAMMLHTATGKEIMPYIIKQ